MGLKRQISKKKNKNNKEFVDGHVQIEDLNKKK